MTVIDALTYAGSLDPLSAILDHPRLSFPRIDIRDAAALANVFVAFRPTWVSHLAAETPVDRSLMPRTSSSRPTWSEPIRC